MKKLLLIYLLFFSIYGFAQQYAQINGEMIFVRDKKKPIKQEPLDDRVKDLTLEKSVSFNFKGALVKKEADPKKDIIIINTQESHSLTPFDSILSIKEYPKERKMIQGYNCFKVVVIAKNIQEGRVLSEATQTLFVTHQIAKTQNIL